MSKVTGGAAPTFYDPRTAKLAERHAKEQKDLDRQAKVIEKMRGNTPKGCGDWKPVPKKYLE